MPNRLNLEIVENGQAAFTAEVAGPIELGRQRTGEPEPYLVLPAGGGPARLLVARQPESNVSRQHALLEAMQSGDVRVDNLSAVPLDFDCGPPLAPHSSAERKPPFTLQLPGRTVRVERGDSVDNYGLRSLGAAAVAPGHIRSGFASIAPPVALGGQALNSLVDWLQTTLGMLQSAIGSIDFLDKAVEALG